MFKAITSSIIFLTLLQVGTVARAQSSNSSKIKSDSVTGEARRWSGEWQLELGGDDFTEGKDEGTAAVVFFKTAFQFHYASWLRASLKPRVDFYAGRLQQRYETDEYKSGLRLTEAYLALTPLEFLEVRGGAISQEYLNAPMLISKRRAFPGAELVLDHETSFSGGHTLKGELIGQVSIPTSYSLNIERQEKEAMPTFATQSLHVSGKNFDALEWRGYVGHYTFNNMPSKVAQESKLLGNSVEGDNPAASRFRYGYDGFFGGAEFCACVPAWPVQPVFEYQRLYNSRAASGFGNAQMWGLGPRIFMGDVTLDLRYRRFFVERDATVAAYTSSFLGNTNRQGDDIEFRLDFRARKFAIVGEWANATTIRGNDLVQRTMTSIFLGVETHYAPFF